MGGTAFLLKQSDKQIDSDLSKGATYLVTARHNLIEAQRAEATKFLLRFNTRDGQVGILETDFADWKYETSDPFLDVAVLPLSSIGRAANQIDAVPYPARNHVNEKMIREMPVTVGDEVFSPGLFTLHYGKDRNIPVIRCGNIAAMPEEKVRIKWYGNWVDIDAYLIEARSLGGLSGSPVFVHFPGRRREKVNEQGKLVITNVVKATQHCLLGLVHGHYDSILKEANSEKGEHLNMGIAIVVPITKVLAVIDAIHG